MSQTRHHETKDSGVEWIGELPSHWTTKRGKNILRLLSRPVRPDDEIVTCFRDGEVTLRKNRREEGFTNALVEAGYQGVEPGDLVVHGMDGFAGSIGVSDSRGKASPVLNVMDSSENKRYLMYYLRGIAMREVFLALSTGIRVRSCDLRWNKLAVLPYIVPPLPEQTAIAAYLDEKCATIDAIIAEAKASIEEYKSWKASVIFETVTKGLNPNAEMKDSGVEWIGEIPKGWKVSAVKRHYSITLGKMLESVPQSNDATLENYMCASNVKWGGIDTTTNRQMWFSPVEKEEYLLKEGDLLVMEGGSAGTSAIYRGEYAPCYMQNSVNRCRSKDGSLTHFLYYWMFLVYHSGHVESACNRATIMHLTKEKLGRLPFVYAPEEEQASIVSYLYRKCSLIDGIILEKEDLIRELENYKRSLIFEVVTGKRRVC